MLLTPNTLLQNGRYRILRRIGQGGMGAVYEALDTRLNNRVAVKQALVTDPTLRQAFQREAQRLARLHHPGLPNVIDHFMEGEGEFLVMRFIDGPDLAQQLEERNAPFPVEQVLLWADDLLDALSYLHSQNPPLIHRDIKPANLKLTESGEVILLDFGLAKGGLPNPTAVGTTPGYTLGYASYEQMVGQPTDARSDLYGLAATLYALMTNHVPPNAIVRMSEQFNGQPDPLLPANELNPQVPPYVAEVLTRVLALNPDQRPPSAPVMRAMLKGPPPVSSKPLPQDPPVIRRGPNAPTRINLDLQRPPFDSRAGRTSTNRDPQPPPFDRQAAPTRRNRDPQQPPFDSQAGRTRILPEEQEPRPPTRPLLPPEEEEESTTWRLWAIIALLLGLLLLLMMCGVGYFLSNSGTATEVVVAPEPPTATLAAFTPTSEPTETAIVEVVPSATEEVVIPTDPTEEPTLTPEPIEEATLTPEPIEEPTLTPEPIEEPTLTPEPIEEPTLTPEPIEEPTLTPEPIEEPTFTPEPIEEPTFTPIPPPATLRVGNGPDLRAPRRTFDVNLDGIINEWGSAIPATIGNVVFQPENWSGPEDLSGVVYATWDEQYLYLAARVTDDTIVQEEQDRLLHRGDAIELFWDIDLAGDFNQESYNDDDAQMVFSPGDVDTPPSSWVHFSPAGNFRDQIVIGTLESLDGYEIEVRIPWSGLGITPQAGQVYGYAVALSDDDTFGEGEQQTQMSTSPQRAYPNPHHWGNFFLDP